MWPIVRGMEKNAQALDVHDVEYAWNFAQRAYKDYQRAMRIYRAILTVAVEEHKVMQSKISKAINRDRESLRRDRLQAHAEGSVRYPETVE